MSNVEKLFEDLKKHPEANRLMREYGKENVLSAYAEAILSVAQKLGIETQADKAEIVEFLDKAESSRKAATDKNIGDMVELDDDSLEDAAGGNYEVRCGHEHSTRDACLWNDYCSLVETW